MDASYDNRSGSAYANPYAYTGRQHDAESGLYEYRNRYYEPRVGRFVSRDPIGYTDGYSLYAAYFSMHMGLDPFGLDWLDCVADCVHDNDPMNLIVDAVLGKLALAMAGGGVPKSFMAWFARHVMKDPRLAARILSSARRGFPLAWRPGKIIATWITRNKALAAKASRISTYIMIIYGPVLAAIEIDCGIYCIGRCRYDGGNTFNVDRAIDYWMGRRGPRWW